MGEIIALHAPAVSVVLDVGSPLPSILYWGSSLSESEETSDLWADVERVPGALDVSSRIPLVPMHGDGFAGRPGLQGHRRGGRQWSPRFTPSKIDIVSTEHGTELTSTSTDSTAELHLHGRIVLDRDGVLVLRATVENFGDSPFMLDSFTISIPMPSHATELGVHTGRWAREFQMTRFPWPPGAWTAENRSGRTSHEHPPYLWVFDAHAGEATGHVWGLHTAWSGNHVAYAERLSDGRRYVQMGELFHPGEICVYPGDRFDTPDIVGVHSDDGITKASWGFHRYAKRISPRRERVRPVHINTWEAIYFDHDVSRLKELADTSALMGIERFVLDDGWFGSRRNDRSGLGDWFVSPDVYPDGLVPLIDHVRSLGMEFGIWVEPEMANPDSDLVRAHPEWILATAGYEPVLGRQQVVLDLSRDDVYAHLLQVLDRLLEDHEIAYVKWDMNRPHVQGSNEHGKASDHDQVIALYRLLDELRSRHPDVEFESCASGGGRIDHEIIKRVERVWTSDSNDALERQHILHGASMLLPLQFLGSHIGPSPTHTTRRRHSMSFRGATALFGHLGVEADVTVLDERERADLIRVISVYKSFRKLLHAGDFVRFDTTSESGTGHNRSFLAHGVFAPDRLSALVCLAQLSTESALAPGRIRIPGLSDDVGYSVQFVPLTDRPPSGHSLGPAIRQPEWLMSSIAGSSSTMTGRFLAEVGLVRPTLWPESAIVVHLTSS